MVFVIGESVRYDVPVSKVQHLFGDLHFLSTFQAFTNQKKSEKSEIGKNKGKC